MSDAEIVSTSSTLVVAGSETTATALTGLTYLLATHSEALAKLYEEILSHFQTEDEINIHNVQQLRYRQAVLDEGLRMYAPVPWGILRVAQTGGDYICGCYVPEG